MSYICCMPNKRKQITAWGHLTIYTLAFALMCGYGYSGHSQENILKEPVTENYQSIITGSQPGAALQAIKPVDAGFSSAHAYNKKTFTDFFEILKSVDRSLASSFTNYESFSNSIAVRQRKADIIFPFHYFW